MIQHKLIQRVPAVFLLSLFIVGCNSFFPREKSILPFDDLSEALETTLTPLISITPSPSVSPSPWPTKTATPEPEWVTGFAEPILAAIADRPPDFEEDFSEAGPNWYLETVNCPDNGCSLSDGVLSVAAQAMNDKQGWAEQPLGSCCSDFKTFVMQVDVDTSKLKRENAAAIWYVANVYQGNKFTTKFHFNCELKNRNRWFIWTDPPGQEIDSGELPLAIQPPITFTLISRDSRVAVYLNDHPISIIEFDGSLYQPGFELCAWSAGGSAALAEFDNAKVWNLDDIEGLP